MNGLIGFFDILGYQTFLENNSAEKSALEVLELITRIPVETKELVRNWAIKFNKEKLVVDFAASMEHLIFSDTIVLLIRYPENLPALDKEAAIIAMIVAASSLTAKMFQNGLPVRGAVHEGEFVMKDYCFAGAGIVRAYKLCINLDFSGAVLSPELASYIEKRQADADPMITPESISKVLVPILSPLKRGEEQRLIHLNWLGFLPRDVRSLLEKDVKQLVLTSFWSIRRTAR